ncbi:hypothetical protein CPB85DRAFT_1352275 [Mucidula mucida]|nr:hypothetical protein CPB85DRAFT_1352275 [Mucidula mucida]
MGVTMRYSLSRGVGASKRGNLEYRCRQCWPRPLGPLGYCAGERSTKRRVPPV